MRSGVAFVQFSRVNAVLESPNFFGSMGTAIWTLLLCLGILCMLGRADKANLKCMLNCHVHDLQTTLATCALKRKCILTDQQFIIEAVAEDLVRGRAACNAPVQKAHLTVLLAWQALGRRFPTCPKHQESWVMAALILVFILFGSLTVMNMLLGVLVEAASESREFSYAVEAMWHRRLLLRTEFAAQAVKTVSTIEREQLEVDFAKKVLWEMIDKGLVCT